MHNYSSMMKKKENKKKINDRVYTKISSGSGFINFTTLKKKKKKIREIDKKKLTSFPRN